MAFAAVDEWAGQLVSGVSDPPVTIEEAGTLWLGYAQVTQTPSFNACPFGATLSADELSSSDGDAFVWWQQSDQTEMNTDGGFSGVRPLIQAIVGP